MNYLKEYQKVNRLDKLLFSQPEHVIFSYSQQAKHLRLLQLQKSIEHNENNNNTEMDYYYQHSFHFRQHNNLQNMMGNMIFTPKRCMMLDSQLGVIQRIQQGKPLNYDKTYKQHVNQSLKYKVFHWYDNSSNYTNNNNSSQFIKQYYYHQQINNICFGRRHFVRSLNSIELSSDHISRNHCQLLIKKGKTKHDMIRYFQLLFGVDLSLNANRQLMMIKKNNIRGCRQKLSRGNKLNRLTRQLWQIIYSYIFLSKDKYYLVDNGSRNGTFFIQCFDNKNDKNRKKNKNNKNKKNNFNKQQQQQQQRYEYDVYGHKIVQSHKLPIRQGYTYQYQGEQYSIKVWRLTQWKQKIKSQSQQSTISTTIITDNNNTNNYNNKYTKQQQQQVSYDYQHQQKTIKYIQQFEQKINWFNNFQKVNKDYIIDQSLLRRAQWKNKLVYKQLMKLKNRSKNNIKKDGDDRLLLVNNNNGQQQQQQGYYNASNDRDQNQQQQHHQHQQQYITKGEFIKLIYQQLLLLKKKQQNIIMNHIIDSNNSSNDNSCTQNNSSENTQRSIQSIECNNSSNNQSRLFIEQHIINTMVISLDFSNDYKKLYCIVASININHNYHLGSHMVINTSRFQFQQTHKCNGYIQFYQKKWSIVSLKTKVDVEGNYSNNNNVRRRNNNQNNRKINNNRLRNKNKKIICQNEDDNQSQLQSDLQQYQLLTANNNNTNSKQLITTNNNNISIFSNNTTSQYHCQNNFVNNNKKSNNYLRQQQYLHQKQSIQNHKQYYYQMDLSNKLANKIWTKIPATSLYQLKPQYCSSYFIRLAHSFYFQLKFINFTQQQSNQQYQHQHQHM